MAEYALFPEGNYDAHAVATEVEGGAGKAYARLAETSTGKPQVVAHFHPINLPPGVEAPRWPLPWYGQLEGRAQEFTVRGLRAMGFQGTDILDAELQTLDQVCRIKVEHSENPNNGKVYVRVAFVNAAGGGLVKIGNPLSQSDRRRFSALMQSAFQAAPEVEGQRRSGSGFGSSTPPEGPSNSALPEDDEVPF